MVQRIRIEDDAAVKALDNTGLTAAIRTDQEAMSHRTRDLEQLSGFAHILRELRYNEVARQSLAVLLILGFALTSHALPITAAIGMFAALLGMIVRLYASGFIMKNRQLATSGPYALVRHPLYTGNIALVIGFALANSSLWALPIAIAFFWFYYPPAIEYEDRKLRGIFGQQWNDWAAQTPALVPRLSNIGGMGSGQWSLARSLRKNGEFAVTLFVIVCAWRVVAPLFPG
jgi:protein-S-isoprenylcysteine O-methyltransferase Ste14